MKTYKITKNEDGIRFSKFLQKLFPSMPTSLTYKLLRKKYFEINKKKADGTEILKNGDTISIFLGEETFNKYQEAKEISSKYVPSDNSTKDKAFEKDRIIYEDDNVIIYNKPVNLLSQGDKTGDVSINSILNDYLKKKNEKGKESLISFTPSVVNRLDRNTEGLIIFAKNYIAAREISSMIKDRRMEKHYRALVNGIVEKDEDTLVNILTKDESKNISIVKDIKAKDYFENEKNIVKLKYKVLKRNVNTTLLDIDLLTGKSHQIRAQLSHINHPIVCDKKYMDEKLYRENIAKFKKKSQDLCCYKIKFSKFENEQLKALDNKIFKI